MVHDQIQNHADIPLVARSDQLLKILHRTVLGIDGIIVGYIIFVISGAWVNGHQPNAGDSQLLQIVQLGDHTLQITDSIAVRVAEGIDEDLVEGAIVIIGAFAQCFDPRNGLLCLFRGGWQNRFRGCRFGCQNRPRGFGGGSGFHIGPTGGTTDQHQNRQQQTRNPCHALHRH